MTRKGNEMYRTGLFLSTVMIVILAFVMTSPTAAQEEENNEEKPAGLEWVVLEVQHRKAQALSPFVSGLKSKDGSVAVDEEANRLILHDYSANIEEMKTLLKELDIAHSGRSLEFRVQVLIASYEKSNKPPNEAIKELLPVLKEVLKYSSFELEAEAFVVVRERSTCELKDDNLSLRFTPFLRQNVPMPVDLEDFRFSVLTSAGRFQLNNRIKLPIGKPVVLGATGTKSTEKAIVLVLKVTDK